VAIFYYATCHNFGQSLIIMMDDGDQYFEKKMSSTTQKWSCKANCKIFFFSGWIVLFKFYFYISKYLVKVMTCDYEYSISNYLLLVCLVYKWGRNKSLWKLIISNFKFGVIYFWGGHSLYILNNTWGKRVFLNMVWSNIIF
jgi:hypothetical protein